MHIISYELDKSDNSLLSIWHIPANTKHLYNICTTSAQRLRRWSNIVQMLYKCFVFAGINQVHIINGVVLQQWPN